MQYDEAHSDGKTPGLEVYGNLFASTGKPGESDDPRVRAMSTHRHRGFDIVFITQWPNKIHHQVRTLVGEHVHMNRAMGLNRAGVLKWSRVQADPYDEKAREKSEEEIWAFPKALFARYISASLHSDGHKFRMPKKVWQALSMLVVGLVIAWVLWAKVVPHMQEKYKQKTVSMKAEGASSSAPAPAAPGSSGADISPPTGEWVSLTAEPVVSLAGCLDSDRGCRCWNTDGDQVDQTQAECRNVVDRGMPFNIYHDYSRGQGIAQDNKRAPERGAGDSPAESPSPSALIGAGLYDVQGREMVYHPSTAN